MAVCEGTPQCASLAGGPPAGLVHVQRLGGLDALQQILIGFFERVGDPVEDCVDRTGADPGAE
jgi:hypothetical protein